MTKIGIIGAGSWGLALSCLWARKFAKIIVYGRDQQGIDELNYQHTQQQYFGQLSLPENIIGTTDFTKILSQDVIVIATPSTAFREIIALLKTHKLSPHISVLIATKGLATAPVGFLSTVFSEELPNPFGFISGPNFAQEIVENRLSAIVISANQLDWANKFAVELRNTNLITSALNDVITPQIAGIVKNIIAIKSGIMTAQGHNSQNAKAWLVSQALSEIAVLSGYFGGATISLSSPAVVGDLVLTSYSPVSRNTEFGIKLHQNNYCPEFVANYPKLLEGVNAIKSLQLFLPEKTLNLPLIYEMLELFSFTKG